MRFDFKIFAERLRKGTASIRFTPGVAAGILALGVAAGLLLWQGRSGDVEPVLPPEPERPSVIVSTGTFARGDTLDLVLKKASLSPVEAAAVAESMRRTFPPRNLRPGDPWTLVRSTAGVFRELMVARGLTEYLVTASTQGGHVASSRAIVLKLREGRTSGVLSSSLWESMAAARVPPDLISEFADVFAWQVDFNIDPRGGDRFSLLWDEKVDPAGLVRGRSIQAATYEGGQTGRKTAVLFDGDYFDEEGGSLRRAFLSAPLAFRRISSRFTTHRFHPILRKIRPHLAIDYAAPTGTPAKSVGDGVVIFKGWDGGHGNFIKVRHNSIYTTGYGHLSRYAAGLRVGKSVRQGEVIGYVGSTGLSTGPHLHFQVWQNGKSVNFLALKMPPNKRVPDGRRADFNAASAALFRRLKGTETPVAAAAPPPPAR